MSKIKICEIIENWADVYEDGKLIGRINNQLQLNDIRLQIAKEKISGVHIITQNFEQINISSTGHLDHWPKNFFDLMEIQLFELCGWNRDKPLT